MQLVGDLHQPLRVADHQVRVANAVPVLFGAIKLLDKLHSHGDTRLAEKLGRDPKKHSTALNGKITSRDAGQWSVAPALWAQETFTQSRIVACDFSGEAFVTGAKGVRWCSSTQPTRPARFRSCASSSQRRACTTPRC